MSKVLYIKANIKESGESRTFRVSDCFMKEYKKNNPDDEITTLDLYKEKIEFLKPIELKEIFESKDEESNKKPILSFAYEFAGADKYVIAAPMWNLSIPAILKAYIDYISVVGITFKYTEDGPVGLLKNKKAVHITTRGGGYNNTNYEMGDRYIRTILSFFGIEDIQTIAAENLDILGVDVEKNVNEGIDKARIIAQSF
ncbi:MULTISPECIES: NAD(P)H-dependent oxidoreductase [Clostridium]|uniref:FMN dependent NADH:quinone oxidoreductase n=1 Tax=Clostridium cibarium TaxID=2762247 RepID=A0ABR8PUP8_9CLOT|nr:MULTISPECIES: NAD(P)H-dependent oxidoreductase [Clostridium]MBD7911908.1 NAD(P)H-dependent oxidoreductase [Clostridium cibarium]